VEIAERAHCLTEESQAMCGELPGAVVQQQAARPVADGPALLEVTGALALAVAADLRTWSPEVGGLALWHAELPGRGSKNFRACRPISRAAGLPGRPGRNGSFCDGHIEKGVWPRKFPPERAMLKPHALNCLWRKIGLIRCAKQRFWPIEASEWPFWGSECSTEK
jgi:prepilin-type processing-associated H-X9-DG protein